MRGSSRAQARQHDPRTVYAASACPSLKFAKGRTRHQEKDARDRAQAKADRAVYAAVDARDGLRCRACGSPDGIERDHIQERSLLGPTTTENVCNLCGRCHRDKTRNSIDRQRLTIRKLTPRGADQTLEFQQGGRIWTS